MKFLPVLAAVIGSASAFVTPKPGASSVVANTALQGYKMENYFGITVETGNTCPPYGGMLLEDAEEPLIKWFQNAEIKNGRVAMVATIGYLVQKSGLHFPLYLGPSAFGSEAATWYLSTSEGITFADVAKATPYEAIAMVPAAGWLQIFFAAGLFEFTAWERQWNQGREIPGDYGYDPLGFTKQEGGWDSDAMKKLRLQEIKNGRLAM